MESIAKNIVRQENLSLPKNFLDVNDVAEIFGCGKNKAYEIMHLVNRDLNKAGKKTFNGKVLAKALFDAYGLN